MESLVPLLADLAVSSTPSLINAFKSSENTAPDSSLERSAGVSLPSQGLPQAPPPPLGSSTPRHRNCVVIPFQHLASTLNGQEKNIYTVAISSIDSITRHTKYYRDAMLEDLEVVVFPLANSYKVPVSVAMVWTPADVTLATNDVMKTPGSALITVGGLNLVNHGVLACDLNYTNRIIKCPIPYSNTPRLNIDFKPVQSQIDLGLKAERCAEIYIRGKLVLAHPICVP